MAFRDTDGTITIDEVAAEKDINTLKNTVSHLEAAQQQIDEMYHLAEGMAGEAATMMQEVIMEFKNQIAKQIVVSEETQNYIQSIVNKYQEIDAGLKTTIESTALDTNGGK